MSKRKTILLIAAACSLVSACAADDIGAEEEPLAGGLLFGLEDQDVEELHERYLGGESLDLTFDRLTAPFDCALYDDLCAQIGREQAIEFTADLVELGLHGASPEEIDAFVDQRLDEGMDLYNEEEAAEDLSFRSSTPWLIASWPYSGTAPYRLRTRAGITTPVFGKRQAWTEAKTDHYDLGWKNLKVDSLCVRAGTNRQIQEVCVGSNPCTESTIESESLETCVSNKSSHKVKTYHERNSTFDVAPILINYRLRSLGSAEAENDGVEQSGYTLVHERSY